jgi:hypothetical protein
MASKRTTPKLYTSIFSVNLNVTEYLVDESNQVDCRLDVRNASNRSMHPRKNGGNVLGETLNPKP